jgi:hypothetical protein
MAWPRRTWINWNRASLKEGAVVAENSHHRERERERERKEQLAGRRSKHSLWKGRKGNTP